SGLDLRVRRVARHAQQAVVVFGHDVLSRVSKGAAPGPFEPSAAFHYLEFLSSSTTSASTTPSPPFFAPSEGPPAAPAPAFACSVLYISSASLWDAFSSASLALLIAAKSSPFSASLRSAMPRSMFCRSSA